MNSLIKFKIYIKKTKEFDLVPCFGKGFTVEKNSFASIHAERTNPGELKFSLASEKGDIISMGLDTNNKVRKIRF